MKHRRIAGVHDSTETGAPEREGAAASSPDPVTDAFFRHYYRRRPVNATFTGVHDHDALLPDWSPEGIQETSGEMRDLLARLRTQPDHPGLPVYPLQVDRTLASGFLEIQLAEMEGDHFQRRNPALYTGEAVFGVLSLMMRDFANAVERAEHIAGRLRQIPSFLESAKITIGYRSIPSSWTNRAITECGGAAHVLGDGLDLWCSDNGLPQACSGAVADAASDALLAFQEFREWLQERPDALPQQSGCGADFYELLLQRGHWCRRSPEDLLGEARECLEGTAHELDAMARAVDPGGWPAVAARLREHHPTADDYLDSYSRSWDACRQRAIETDLVTWPEFPIRYVEMPRWAWSAAAQLYFLNYRSPAPFDPVGVVDYFAPPIRNTARAHANAESLRATNNSVIKLNHVVHHGGLGHHVQNYYAYRCASHVGQVAAVDCASRIGMFCGGSMAEGWACYATDIMREVGFLNQLELVAEQHSRLRQLARAIVDIGLHYHTMDEAEACRLHEERVGMTHWAAVKEVTRTSMFPGTAIMYWLGTNAIHDLRVDRQAAEGASFSLRSFHDTFLSFGSIPVLLIAELMSQEASQ